MALTQLAPPYPIFTDKNGDPLDNGYLYFGEVNKNPETNPIQVYYDSALTQPAAQPLRTSNGYVMRNGTPALIYADVNFSVTVRDKNSALVIYSPVGYGINPAAAVTGSVTVQDQTGDGVTTTFGMGASPNTENATNVYIDGVYQQKNTYTTSGSSIIFSEAPPLNASIEIVSQESPLIGGASASQISYNQGGVGAVNTTVKAKLQEFVSVKDFGAVGDGVTDDTAAIQAAIDAVETQSAVNARGSSVPLLRSSFPLTKLFFPAGKYLVSSQLNAGVICSRYHWIGDHALIFANNGTMSSDYLVKASQGYDAIFEGIAFGSTELGCIEFACPNVSSAMVLIKDCNFIGNTNATNSGTAVKYANQSSILSIKDCLFNNVQHPFEWVVGDFININGCWFDCAQAATYADDTGYFNSVGGQFHVENCLFASGPGDKGTRVAFFNCDNNVELIIRKTRIAFEFGGGVVINWKVPFNNSLGAQQRNGFTIDDCSLSPRGQNETYGSTPATPVVRLYTMPNRMKFENLSWYNANQAIIGVAPSTTLETLYATAQTKFGQQVSYSYGNSTGGFTFLVPTTDRLVHKKWLELFNVFDFGFEPEVSGSEVDNYYKTYFTGDDFNNVFQVSGWVSMLPGAQFSKQWLVSLKYDQAAATYSFVEDTLDTVGNVNSRNVTIKGKFYKISTGVYSDTIAITEDLNDYLFACYISSISTIEFNTPLLYIRPMKAFNKVNTFIGTPLQSI